MAIATLVIEANVLSSSASSLRVALVEGLVVIYMLFTVHILRSSSNQLYIGQTNNIENREKQQLHKTLKAAKFIKDGDDFHLVYKEEYSTRLEAMRREKQLKGWSRAKKVALINGDKELLKKLSKKTNVQS